MKIKKMVALSLTAAMLCAAVPSVSAASVAEDTVVYSYDYTQCADSNAVLEKGVTIYTANSWGTPAATVAVGDKSSVWWVGSTRSTSFAQMTDIANIAITSDNEDAAAESENDIVVVDLDYGIRLSNKTSNEVAQFRFVGTDGNDEEVALATFEMNIPASKNTGTAYFVGNESVSVPYIGVTTDKNANPGQRTNLKIAFDMQNKTYSAWYIKRAELGATSATEDAPQLLAADVPMLCGNESDVKIPSAMYYSIKNNAGSETLAPVSITTTILSDASAVEMAKAELSLAEEVKNDITLPESFMGCDVTWTSNNDAITDEGVVTRPAYGSEAATGTLVASISRGDAQVQEKEFMVTVPAVAQPPIVIDDSVLYRYDYTEYADADAVKAKGITINTANSWGTPAASMVVGDLAGVYWIGSARSNFTEMTELVDVAITSDNSEAAAESENDVIVVDLDYGVRLSGKGYNEVAQLSFTGQNSDETEAVLATFEMNIPKDKNVGTAYFVGNESVSVPYIGVLDSQTANPGQRTNLKVAFDMKNKTYSAWYIKRAEYGASSATEDAPQLLVADAQMLCGSEADVTIPSTMTFSIMNNAGSDVFAPVSITTTILSDEEIVAAAKETISIAEEITEDISLPSVLLGCDVIWTSENPAITNDGKVTRPSYGADDATGILTAVLTRGDVNETITFDVKVPAEAFVPEVSENGIWTIDNMDYESTESVPKDKETNKFYFAAGSLTEFAEAADVDTANAELNGYVYAEDSSLKIVRASSEGTAQAQDTVVTKYISQTGQHVDDDIVLEFEYERIGSPDVYIAVQALNSWKGPVTMNNTIANTLNTYGVASTPGKSTNKVTIVFNGKEKTYDTYFNGVLYKADQAYRYTDAGTMDISRIAFTVKADTAVGDGIAIKYVRLIDKSAYGNWALDNETELTVPTTVDAYTTKLALPVMGGYNNNISWTSSNEEVITAEGVVKHGDEDVQVAMTGIYTNIITGETKPAGEYVVTVEKAGVFTAEIEDITDIADIKINFANAEAESKDVKLYYASYDANGALAGVSIEDISVPVGRTGITRSITAADEAASVKVFVWDTNMIGYAVKGCSITAE